MPTYEYRCKNCNHEFELFQSMSASVKKKCPECKKMTLERLIGTGAAVIFKGSGFYETDYRSKSYSDAKDADTKAAKKETETQSSSESSSKTEKSIGSDKKSAKPTNSENKPEKKTAKKS